MIRASIIGAEEFIFRLKEVEPKVSGLVREAVRRATLELVNYIKHHKLSGQVLRARPPGGHLRRSINPRFEENLHSIIGSAGTNVKYAAIHEYGGVTRAHVIQARKKKALAFQVGGVGLVRKSVQHPGSKMPERSFLRSSLRDNEEKIKKAIEQAVLKGLKK
jgi:phage gpG-like protein